MYKLGQRYKPDRKWGSLRNLTAASVLLLIGGVLGFRMAAPQLATSVLNVYHRQRSNDAQKSNKRSGSSKVDVATLSGNGITGSTKVETKSTSAGDRPVSNGNDLFSPAKKDIAMQLVSSAENSSLDWKAQYGYIEDIKDGRGYTAGIIGFCSGTGDMLDLLNYYKQIKPSGNILTPYLGSLQKLVGSSLLTGLDAPFAQDWKKAAADPLFQQAQDHERDRSYFNPAVTQAKADGLRALGQFIYYDAIVMHGPGESADSFGGLRASVVKKVKPPSQGGDEKAYLSAFLDARKALMLTEAAHDNTDRVDTAQRKFLNEGNFDLNTPLSWTMYSDQYTIK